ncbi:Atu4866 domain-containing protein [Microbacterium oleivorans]|uniref:Atu4866 domain-containing protein n=1 Tax=Microbacterium TaxID=33882 RepID=UPI0020424333|nr:Atu4866 domain-containing protein [Microbacterium oleivorans]MCM3695380.1 Atu4866 domain-containing protein [Microbacterium oleivorans]
MTNTATDTAIPALVITDARVHVSPEHVRTGDLATEGGRIVARAAPDPIRIDGSGASVVPLLVDTVFDEAEPPASDAFDLVPGNPASFALVAGSVSASSIRHQLVVHPRQLRAVVVDGAVLVRDGVPVRPEDEGSGVSADGRLGAYRDTIRDMTQHLLSNGRYTETRGGRRDAYTGRYWIDGDRVTYLDDTGFWAFGQFHGDVLHHAGFVLRPVH